MPMKVTFELSDKDLAHFKSAMIAAREATKQLPEEDVIFDAERLLAQVLGTEMPAFVSERLEKLRTLIAMLRDEEWRLPAQDRRRIRYALAYFTKQDDLIPDSVPALGLLDDALMIELILQSVRHEIEAYERFCQFRDNEAERAAIQSRTAAVRKARLEAARKRFIEQMHGRRSRDRASSRGPRLTLW